MFFFGSFFKQKETNNPKSALNSFNEISIQVTQQDVLLFYRSNRKAITNLFINNATEVFSKRTSTLHC